MRISLLGAESTGKTWLGIAIRDHFAAQGRDAGLAPEFLRQWCGDMGRTPLAHEQMAIVNGQMLSVQAIKNCEIVISDTSPLMTAIYSQRLFADRSMNEMAIRHQKSFDVTLVTGLDLPWKADGHQRDGPQSREPVDTLLREVLTSEGIPYATVYGEGLSRLQNALVAIHAADPRTSAAKDIKASQWSPQCDECSDAICEGHLFRRLPIGQPAQSD